MPGEDAMSLYPAAELVPWKPTNDVGRATYYAFANAPEAIVLHRMQGWKGTARQWASEGHYGASWHYTVGLDGSVMQHLEHVHGGFHAGIPGTAPRPRWEGWKGYGRNVNSYTVGVELEGFWYGYRFPDGTQPPLEARTWPEAQLRALRDLCRWLSADLGIPYDRAHFPPHADIDLVNRVNDFDAPERRGIVYDYLFATEDEMTRDEILALVNERIDAALAHQFPLLLGEALSGGFTSDEAKTAIQKFVDNLPHIAATSVDYNAMATALELGAKATATSLRNLGR